MVKAALLSVSDRTNLIELAKALQSAGYKLLATSGTTKHLAEHSIETVPIEQYTGQREILDGRVKTLHPKIHAGLLARRDKPEHMAELEREGIWQISIAVINLYPFIQGLSGDSASDPGKMIELIDVGGPTMLRASAKNFLGVLPVIDPTDYPEVIEYVSCGSVPGNNERQWRKNMAVKVFKSLSNYDLCIAKYFAEAEFLPESGAKIDLGNLGLGAVNGCVFEREQTLRYGENPHQKGVFYRPFCNGSKGWQQLSGKELSYNNLLDFDATQRVVEALKSSNPATVIVKHLNPCGAATGSTLLEALVMAKKCDPRSHFGGIIGFNRSVDLQVAENIREDFAEVIVAPNFEPDALALLIKNKNLRLIKVEDGNEWPYELRSVRGGLLMQEQDRSVSDVRTLPAVTKSKPSESELNDLQLAWSLCAHVKSNAIVLVKAGLLIGVGAGQMSRIDSVELAISKARTHGHDITGAVAASDAFFPFSDGVETLAKAGVRAIVVPAGAKRDSEVCEVANGLGVSIVHAPDRHFRH